MKKACTGFTLLEVLVALAILAVGLGAAIKAISSSADNLDAVRQRVVAEWVAENELALLRADHAWPSPGRAEGEAANAGRNFRWRREVEATPNTMFRKADIVVLAASSDGSQLAHLTGYL